MNQFFLSIDLGTTGLKVSILSENGNEICRASRDYPIDTPWEGTAEQNPASWWNALVSCCDEIRAFNHQALADIAGIGICGQMHTHVYLGSDGRPLRSAITWMDQRSRALLDEMALEPDFVALVFNQTFNNASTTYTAPNCAWVMKYQPEIWRSTKHILIAKDYLKYLLTGEMLTDYSDAAGTMLFNVAEREWSGQMLHLFGIGRALLPDVAPSSTIMGKVTPTVARALGIPAGTPVNNGCSDNSAAALGSGMITPGQATLIIGTAGVVSVCSDRPIADSFNRIACWNYCLENKWISLGVTQTAGESLNWFKKCFDSDSINERTEDAFLAYDEGASKVPPGSDGLVFLPYLNGERTPYWDSYARGVFFGVNLDTRKQHFIRAVMEGVSFSLRNNFDAIESLGVHVKEVRATGGGLRSKTWFNILSGILNKPIRKVSNADPGNSGNAMLCGMALGAFSSVESAFSAFGPRESDPVISANPDKAYEKNYKVFLRLYNDLKFTFKLAME